MTVVRRAVRTVKGRVGTCEVLYDELQQREGLTQAGAGEILFATAGRKRNLAGRYLHPDSWSRLHMLLLRAETRRRPVRAQPSDLRN